MKLPEKTEGPWVTSFDPLTLQRRYTIDYSISFAVFPRARPRSAARQRVQTVQLPIRDAARALHDVRREDRLV